MTPAGDGEDLVRAEQTAAPVPLHWLRSMRRTMDRINKAVMVPCMAALLLAAGILTYSVVARYLFKSPTEWQDETAVFLLIGATFLSGARVQSLRGHVAVQALSAFLPARANRWRMRVVDGVAAGFCTFFAWKSWTLFAEALREGYTSNSTWGPALWIPYVIMAAGVSMLALQLWIDCACDRTDEEGSA